MKIPLVDFLLVCSRRSLQDFELSRLNLKANLRKTLIKILDDAVEAEGEARLARLLIEHRDAKLGSSRPAIQTSFEFHSHPALPPAHAEPVHCERALPGPRRIRRQKEISNHGTQSGGRRRRQKESIAS